MNQLDPARVAAALLAAPHAALLGLTVRAPRLRERAAERVARAIVDGPERPHSDQLSLLIGG